MDLGGKNIKLIVSEVDGVLTNGCIFKDEMCNTVFKQYNLKDFEAINEIKKDFNFVFISSDNAINYNLFRKKNIPFFWAQKSKLNVLYNILRKYEFTASELMYVGGLLSDKECMNLSELSVCSHDSPNTIKKVSSIVLNSLSGEGVLLDLYENVLKNKN